MRKNNNDSVIILDTSNIQDFADYCGLIYELKKENIVDGKNYQIDQANDLLMDSESYSRCKAILKKFGVIAVNAK